MTEKTASPEKTPRKYQANFSKVRDSLVNLVTGLGTAQDRNTHSEFVNFGFSAEQLGTFYRHWAFAKAINIPVEDMVREWRTVGAPSIEAPDTIDDFYLAEIALNVREHVSDALKWARVYGSALIVLDTADAAPDMSLPLDAETVQRGGLLGLTVYDSTECVAEHMISERSEERRGRAARELGRGLISRKPVAYTLRETGRRIHPSRVIRFDGYRLPWPELRRNNFWGGSIIEQIYSAVKNAAITDAAVTTLVSEANVDVVSVRGLFQSLVAGAGASSIIERFRLGARMKSVSRLLVLDRDEEEYQRHPVNFSALPQIIEQQFGIIAAAADVPISRFLGESAKGLNATGEGDIRNYYDAISAKQEADLAPQLRLLDEILMRHVFGHRPPDWYSEFNPLWTVSDMDRASIDKIEAETDLAYLDAGVVQPQHVAKKLLGAGRYEGMTAEDVKALEVAGDFDFDFNGGADGPG